MIRTILFATDLGVFTSYMLQHVVSLAEAYRAEVVVLHVVEPPGKLANAVMQSYLPQEPGAGPASERVEEVILSIRAQIRDVLEDEYMHSPEDISCVTEIRVLQGHPAEVIPEEAKRGQVDLIIMGSHGPKARDDHILGSVTNKVLQRAKVPVYMVPMVSRVQLWPADGAP